MNCTTLLEYKKITYSINKASKLKQDIDFKQYESRNKLPYNKSNLITLLLKKNDIQLPKHNNSLENLHNYIVDYLYTVADFIKLNSRDISSFDIIVNTLYVNKINNFDELSDYFELRRYEVYIIFRINDNNKMTTMHFFKDGLLSEFISESTQFTYEAIYRLHKNIMSKHKSTISELSIYADCVVASDVAALIAHEIVGHIAEHDNQFNYTKLNNDIVANEFSVREVSPWSDINIPYPAFFDEKGFPTSNKLIIDKGEFKRKLKNGNHRIGYSTGLMMNRMNNIEICKGKNNIQQMISSIERGFLLSSPIIGLVSKSKNEFSIEVDNVKVIDYGEVKDNITTCEIKSKISDFINNISMIGNETLWRGGDCEKRNDIVFVGMGGVPLKTKIHLKTTTKNRI